MRIIFFQKGQIAVTSFLFLFIGFGNLPAAEKERPTIVPRPVVENEAELRKATAVTLNYCRAAFHRIQRCPSKRVLLEEQERILNNLNLTRVADLEVIKLYAVVLSEIGQIKIVTKERTVIQSRFKRIFRKQMIGNIVSVGSQFANGEYGKALKTGARSWWDYRTLVWNRDLDLWQIEKTRISAIADKSSLLLDTFWKLTRQRQIPDRWLVRPADLDKLDAIVREPNPRVRLRVLRRMKPFMEYYPPYWYYLARTQQQLGQLFAAASTYEHLESIGKNHFRKDDLLAAGTANRAAIQSYLRQPGSVKTARRALNYSTAAWEVNLICASVLIQHKQNTEAEDAILRNLDVNLETENSLAVLLDFYCHTKNLKKLHERLNDPKTISTVPVPALLRCLPFLKKLKPRLAIFQHLQQALEIRANRHFGPDDLCIRTNPQWRFQTATVSVSMNGKLFSRPKIKTDKQQVEVCFQRVLDLGSLLKPEPLNQPLTLHIVYSQQLKVSIALEKLLAIAATPPSNLGGGKKVLRAAFNQPYRITRLQIGKVRVLDFRESNIRQTETQQNSLRPSKTDRPLIPGKKVEKSKASLPPLQAPSPIKKSTGATQLNEKSNLEFTPPVPKRKE